MRGPVTRLASLDLTRCFVAVGRRMSITLAAQDLCLTQSAVSRQIQALEESLGVQLLNRVYSYCSIKPIGVAAGSGEPVWSVASGSRGSAGAAVQGQASAHGRDRGGCVAFRSDGRMGGIRDHWKA